MPDCQMSVLYDSISYYHHTQIPRPVFTLCFSCTLLHRIAGRFSSPFDPRSSPRATLFGTPPSQRRRAAKSDDDDEEEEKPRRRRRAMKDGDDDMSGDESGGRSGSEEATASTSSSSRYDDESSAMTSNSSSVSCSRPVHVKVEPQSREPPSGGLAQALLCDICRSPLAPLLLKVEPCDHPFVLVMVYQHHRSKMTLPRLTSTTGNRRRFSMEFHLRRRPTPAVVVMGALSLPPALVVLLHIAR